MYKQAVAGVHNDKKWHKVTNYININTHNIAFIDCHFQFASLQNRFDALTYNIDHSEWHLMMTIHCDTPLISIYLQLLTCVMWWDYTCLTVWWYSLYRALISKYQSYNKYCLTPYTTRYMMEKQWEKV